MASNDEISLLPFPNAIPPHPYAYLGSIDKVPQYILVESGEPIQNCDLRVSESIRALEQLANAWRCFWWSSHIMMAAELLREVVAAQGIPHLPAPDIVADHLRISRGTVKQVMDGIREVTKAGGDLPAKVEHKKAVDAIVREQLISAKLPKRGVHTHLPPLMQSAMQSQEQRDTLVINNQALVPAIAKRRPLTSAPVSKIDEPASKPIPRRKVLPESGGFFS